MNGNRWLVLIVSLLFVFALDYSAGRYLLLGRDAVSFIVVFAVMIILAVQVRRGRLAMPAGFFVRPARGPVLFGLALVLGSVAWLAGGILFFGGNASYGTLIPFFVLLLTGLMIIWGGLWYKVMQWLLRGK